MIFEQSTGLTQTVGVESVQKRRKIKRGATLSGDVGPRLAPFMLHYISLKGDGIVIDETVGSPPILCLIEST